jgi:low affinity Fe/Cu permease
MASEPTQKSRAVLIGDMISERTSKLFAHPYMQIGVILFCIGWFALGLHADLLTAALSILAITLTQMVLNGQYDREAEAHRRDVAMHAKLDELIAAKKGARNELVGLEEKDEEEIVQLKEEVKEALEESTADPKEREEAKRTVDKVAEEVKSEVRRKRNSGSQKKPAAAAARQKKAATSKS